MRSTPGSPRARRMASVRDRRQRHPLCRDPELRAVIECPLGARDAVAMVHRPKWPSSATGASSASPCSWVANPRPADADPGQEHQLHRPVGRYALGFSKLSIIAAGIRSGLVPGVFAGSLVAALIRGEWKLEGFHDGPSMGRYLVGAALMGFGGMLAGGCAVGAGVTGGSIFALTAWVALAAMWAGAIVTHLIVDGNIVSPVLPSGSGGLDLSVSTTF